MRRAILGNKNGTQEESLNTKVNCVPLTDQLTPGRRSVPVQRCGSSGAAASVLDCTPAPAPVLSALLPAHLLLQLFVALQVGLTQGVTADWAAWLPSTEQGGKEREGQDPFQSCNRNHYR